MKISTLITVFITACTTTLTAMPVFSFDIIAHRGASGYLPEHTLPAAVMAHAQGANYIEQDVVLSKDNILVVLHDIHLETVTDVESRFPDRKRQDGRWYAIDFTLNELKQLRVHERQNSDHQPVFKNRYQGTGQFFIATFEEQLTTIRSLNRTTQRQVGLYPEIKSPAFHRAEGKDISHIFIQLLNRYNLNDHNANIIVQCFDFKEIKRLRRELGLKTKLVQLFAENDWNESDTDYDWLKSTEGLTELVTYVDRIGPWYAQLISEAKSNDWELTSFAKRLQNFNFDIHPYTFRVDALPKDMSANLLLNRLVDAGADGVFTDQVPDVLLWQEQLKSD